ncbi:MAG: phosphoglucosamine mutase [Proteobacteria bacterium]|nr:phosphoglucosamine mutase [Pseudomonadota bacterium]
MENRRLFGTDGVRGLANQYPMTTEMVTRIGMAAGSLLKKGAHRNRVIIAKDTRLSGYMIENALTAGFLSVGIDVMLVGPMPTPAVSMLIRAMRADMGVMISASHNPYHDNGLKIFNHLGLKLEDEVEEQVQNIVNQRDLNHLLASAENIGRAKRLDDAAGRYVEYAKYTFPKEQNLDGLKMVLDCANGSAYHLAPTIFWELGADVTKIACEPNGFNINKDCGAMHPQELAQQVKQHHADIGIALDGDADRIVACDEHGHIIHGDHLIAAIATYLHQHRKLKNESVVLTHMSNMALEHYLNSLGLKVWRTKVGDRHVFKKMQEEKCLLGAEQSGHIIYSKCATTGDGVVAALALLAYIREHNVTASSIHKLFKLYPQMLKNIRYQGNSPLDSPEIQQKIEALKSKHPDYRFLIRPSGTEDLVRVMVEGPEQEQIEILATTVVGYLDSRFSS